MPVDGWIEHVDEQAKLAAQTLLEQRQALVQAAGPPWRRQHLTEQQALAKIQEYNTPTPQLLDRLRQVPDRELVASALDAVKRVTKAEKSGAALPTLGTTSPAMGGAIGGGGAVPQ